MGKTDLRFDPRIDVEIPNASTNVSLGPYWATLLRRRWTVITVAAVLTTLAVLASYRMQPIYKATARVQVDAETPQIQSLNELYNQIPSDQDFLRTQIQILQTDSLAWRTIQQLELDSNPAFAPVEKSDKGGEQDPDRRKINLIGILKSNLAVELVPGSRVIKVSYESTDPALAAQVANALVESYLDFNFREKYDATRQASGRMEQQLDELKAKVEKSQRDLIEYQREHSIVAIGGKQSVVEQRLGELSSQLTVAQSDRIQKESFYNQVRSNPEKVASLAQNQLLQGLQEKHAEFRQQYVEALAQYGPSFPKVVRLQKQVEEYESLINKERNRVVQRVHSDYLAAVDRENLLRGVVGKQKSELGDFNKLLVQQNMLKGEFEGNQQLYQRLLEHLKDATVSAGLKSGNIHLVDAALRPMYPVRPQKFQNIMLGLWLGLMLGMVLAFVQEGLDHSIKSPEELEMLISLPSLAVIPARNSLRKPPPKGENGGGKPWAKNGTLELAVLDHPSSALAESYRALRTSTLLSMALHPPQAMLVASANAGEGKTTTTINLAMALAQQQSDILLMDCDLRKPGIARALDLRKAKGLSTVLTGGSTLEFSLQRYSKIPNLWVLASGPVPPNPAELLSSSAMKELLYELRGRFQYIVLDSPPLLMVTDGTILSTLVDGVILIVESGVTSRKAVLRACRVLQNVGAKTLGGVLNKVDLRFDGYYGSYPYRGYYSYYGASGSTKNGAD